MSFDFDSIKEFFPVALNHDLKMTQSMHSLPGHSPPTTPEGQDTSSENMLPADLITILHPMREIYCSQINAIFRISVSFFCKVMERVNTFNG